MSVVKPENVLEIPSHVVSREVGGDAVLLDLNAGTYFSLDPIGARMWELIGRGASVAAICDELVQEYDVSRETLQADVIELCDKLLEEKLVALRS